MAGCDADADCYAELCSGGVEEFEAGVVCLVLACAWEEEDKFFASEAVDVLCLHGVLHEACKPAQQLVSLKVPVGVIVEFEVVYINDGEACWLVVEFCVRQDSRECID